MDAREWTCVKLMEGLAIAPVHALLIAEALQAAMIHDPCPCPSCCRTIMDCGMRLGQLTTRDETTKWSIDTQGCVGQVLIDYGLSLCSCTQAGGRVNLMKYLAITLVRVYLSSWKLDKPVIYAHVHHIEKAPRPLTHLLEAPIASGHLQPAIDSAVLPKPPKRRRVACPRNSNASRQRAPRGRLHRCLRRRPGANRIATT